MVHHLAAEWPSTSRITASAHVIQNTGSKEFIERKPSVPINCGQQTKPNIASACAGRRPSRAHARSPARKIVTAPARAEKMRIANNESPNRSSPSRAWTATTGPWST